MANRDILDAIVQARNIINAKPVPMVGRKAWPPSQYYFVEGAPFCYTCRHCDCVCYPITPGDHAR